MHKKLIVALGLGGLLLAAPTLLSAQGCEDVIFRLWSPDQVRYHEAGESLEIEVGEAWDLYVHYRSRSENPYTTKSEISYPETFSLRGPRAASVARILGLEKQNDQDLASGRMRIQGKETGRTQLAYRMLWVAQSGVFEAMPASCKQGLIPIRVRPADSDKGDPEEETEETDLATYRAADELLEKVYMGLLRRPTAGEVSEEHLKMVLDKGHRGAVLSAMELAASDEFQALHRPATQDPRAQNGRQRGIDPRYQSGSYLNLLSAMYTDLYGTTQIDMEEHQRNIKELWNCFNETDGREACRRFARELIKSEHFAQRHETLIDQLPESYHRDRK